MGNGRVTSGDEPSSLRGTSSRTQPSVDTRAGASGLAWATAKVDIISVSGAGPPKASSSLGVTIPTVVGGETSSSWAAAGDAPERMRATMAMRAVMTAAREVRRVDDGDCCIRLGEGGGYTGNPYCEGAGKKCARQGKNSGDNQAMPRQGKRCVLLCFSGLPQ